MSDLVSALEGAGLAPSYAPKDDGEIHRIPTQSKPRSKNGWYVLAPGGHVAYYGDWADPLGRFYRWTDGEQEVDKEFLNRVYAKIDEEQAKKARMAEEFFGKCRDEGHSDYLERKKIGACGVKFSGDYIVIPVRDGRGKIWSYQKIGADGKKDFMTGGKVKGCYYMMAKSRVEQTDTVIVCEGFATGAAIHEQTGLPVCVAFMAGNLRSVCDSIPFSRILVAADHDKSGAGEEAAKATGRRYVMPQVEGWDFSDAHVAGKDIRGYFRKPEEEAIEVHGLVGEIANWITSTAIRPQPVLSLAAAISFMGVVKGHRFESVDRGCRTNVLAMAMAPTASGKEHPQQAIMRLMRACGLGDQVMAKPKSGSGLLNELSRVRSNGLLVLDEVGRFLGHAMSKNAGGYQREIVDYIIESSTKADDVLHGHAYADPRKNPRIDIIEPNLCILGSSVRERITENCTGREIVDGFLNRWLLFETTKRTPIAESRGDKTPPAALVDRIKAIIAEPIQRNEEGFSRVRTVQYTPEAWDMIKRYREAVDKRHEVCGYPLSEIYGRCNEHVNRLSLIISDGTCVGTRDVICAMKIVNQSIEAMKRFIGEMADNQQEQDFNRVRELVHRKGMISKTELTRQTQFILGGAKRREEIIQSLLDSDSMVEMEESATRRGRRTVVYKAVI